MRDIAAIGAAYSAVDSMLEQEVSEAAAFGNQARAAQIEERQRINDQAYFVLCWGQLEAEINDVCRRAVGRRQASVRWEDRRGWDIYSLNDRRLSGLSFEDRAAMITDRAGGKGSPYAAIMKNYNLRNQIAHGQLLATRIDVPDVIREFYLIQSQLKD